MRVKNAVSVILCLTFMGLVGYGIWVFMSGYLSNTAGSGFVETSGRIEGTEYHAASKISGRVDEISVEEGQDINIGEKVALIYSPQLSAMINQAKGNFRKAEANMKLAEIDYKRYKRLIDGDAVPQAEFEKVENRYMMTKEDVEAAKNELDKLNADLNDAKIVAPVTGKVVSKIVHAGEVIAAGTPIVTIVNMDKLYLKLFLPTEMVGKVSVGDEARIFPDADTEEIFDAVVDKIAEKAEFTSKNVETKSQRTKLVFEVKLKIKENRGHKLKPGMPAEAVIRIDNKASWNDLKRK